jgi:hypothetical protein
MVWKQSEDSALEVTGHERRQAIRYPASGAVWLRIGGRSLEGRLVDRSTTGFRVAYASGDLETGEEVDFVIGHQEGRARVVWNRFTSRHWESGLFIL